MKQVHLFKSSKILEQLDIKSISESTKFKIRDIGKVTAMNFLQSFFSMIESKCYSLRQWAMIITCLSNESIRHQSLSKRLNSRTLDFVKSIFAQAISVSSHLKSEINQLNCLSQFNRVILEDSSCIQLPEALSAAFPGSTNQYNNSAVARIHLRMNLLTGDYLKCELSNFRKHDATFASDIVEELEPNDLSIRDLGYTVYTTLNEIDAAEAFYISRYKINAAAYCPQGGHKVDLAKVLKAAENKGLTKMDLDYFIGAKEKLRCRVICILLEEEQLKKRRRQIKKNGNRNKGKKLNYLHRWNIFINNLGVKQASIDEIYRLYSLRWHIELIFKSWKSYLNVSQIFKSVQGPNPMKPEILLYLCLTYIVLFVNPKFKEYRKKVFRQYSKILSPMKFVKATVNGIITKLEASSIDILQQLEKNCCYDIRRDRVNIFEKLIYY